MERELRTRMRREMCICIILGRRVEMCLDVGEGRGEGGEREGRGGEMVDGRWKMVDGRW